jgi:hypothetical protein
MKRSLFFVSMMFLAAACNDAGTTDSKTGDSAKATEAKTADIVMPYTLTDGPYKDWQPGDKNHAVTVMNSLKAFETGDMVACLAAFGDSVDVRFDGFRQKFSKDSLAKFFAAERAKISSVKIYMDDWESVISKDKTVEYVTMWYKQVVTDIKGKVDSVNVVDDCRIKNGKIITLDEKIQRYPAKK